MVHDRKIVYTIVTENYLCFALVLKESFIKHNPHIIFYICVIPESENFTGNDSNGIISTSVLNSAEYNDMRIRYDNLALVCALKPYFAKHFLEIQNIESIIYLDADISVYNSFEEIFSMLEDASEKKSIILTPHVINKLGIDNMVRNINYLTYGTYNAGFFAIKNNQHGREFIEWWKELMFRYCKNELKYGFFYDQSWLNLVPNYFYNYYTLLIHPGCNVAYWNVDERDISKNNGNYYCIERPLIFYHFARFNYYDEQITKNVDEINPLMKEIYADYKYKLKEMGIEKSILNKTVPSSRSRNFIAKFKRFLKS